MERLSSLAQGRTLLIKHSENGIWSVAVRQGQRVVSGAGRDLEAVLADVRVKLSVPVPREDGNPPDLGVHVTERVATEDRIR